MLAAHTTYPTYCVIDRVRFTNEKFAFVYAYTILFIRIEGGELFDRVIDDEFILSERACTVLVRQLCQAMEFVHHNNIIHLDLKPENILCLSREGNRLKIIDFGLARRFDPEKKLQVCIKPKHSYIHKK